MRVRRLILLLLFSLGSPVLHATQSICAPECRLVIVDGHPHEALRPLAEQAGFRIALAGEPLDPITAELSEPSMAMLIHAAGREAGYLVSRRGNLFTFFGDDLTDPITITHTLHRLRASEAAEQLGRFENIRASVLRDANALVLRGTLEELRRSVELLETIDQKSPNVLLELLVVKGTVANDEASIH